MQEMTIDEQIEQTRQELRSLRAKTFHDEAEFESETEELEINIDMLHQRLDSSNLTPHVYMEELGEGTQQLLPHKVLKSQATLCSLLHRTDTEVDLIAMVQDQARVSIKNLNEVIRTLLEEKSQVENELNTQLAVLQRQTDTLRWEKEAHIRDQESEMEWIMEQIGNRSGSDNRRPKSPSNPAEEEFSTSTIESPVDVEDEFNSSLTKHFERMTGWLTKNAVPPKSEKKPKKKSKRASLKDSLNFTKRDSFGFPKDSFSFASRESSFGFGGRESFSFANLSQEAVVSSARGA